MKRYTLNENVLDLIDTQEKAYFLGYFYGDGYNYEKRNKIVITTTSIDKYILEKFKQLFETNRPLLKYQPKNCKHANLQYILCITNRHLCNKLCKLGAPQSKTFKIKFPNFLDDSLIHHFIRGYFDADGCISLRNTTRNYYSNINITSNSNFIYEIQSYLNKKNIYSTILKEKRSKNISYLMINTLENNDKFIKYIYKDATIFLERKYNKAMEFLNNYNNIFHGLYYHPLYDIWSQIKIKCKKNKLLFDKKWNDFKTFYDWAINNGWKKGVTLLRYNIKDGYIQNNCRFGSRKEGSNNTKRTIFITIDNETKSIKDWSRDSRCEIKYTTLYMRIKNYKFPININLLKKKYYASENLCS